MKIGVFSDSYKPYTSGVVTSICTFRDELSQLGHDVFIFAPSYPNYHEQEDKVFRFPSVPAPVNPDFTLAVPIAPRPSALVKKLKLDLIHVHSPFILGRLGANNARRFGLPLVFTYHTKYEQYVHYVPVAHDLAREFTVKYSVNFSNRCDLVVTPSYDIKNLIIEYGVRAPVKVIPTGVDVGRFEHGDADWLRRQFNIPQDYKICLFVGRLTREKNIDFLIKAFARIKETFPRVCLVIVANGPMEKELKKIVVNLGLILNHDVIFTGYLPDEWLVNAYCGADLFVFASVTETQGIVLVEAMAAGLPVIAVNATGSREMIQDGVQGHLTPYDLEAFSRQVRAVLENEEQARSMSSQARLRAASLSSRTMAHNLEAVYLQLVEKRRPKARLV